MLKRRNFITILLILGFKLFCLSQTNTAEKVSFMQEYLNNIRTNLFDLRSLTDSANTLALIDSLDRLVEKVDLAVNQIEVPVTETIAVETETKIADLPDEGGEAMEDKVVEYKKKPPMNLDFPNVGKFDQLSMLKTKLYFNFGLNGLHHPGSLAPGNGPEINTTRSWFWAIGFKRPISLSKGSDRLRLYYGLDYLGNSYSVENGVRLYNNSDNKPDFEKVDSLSNNNLLNVGYIRLPLEFSFQLSKKFKVGVGVFAGYRVRSVQKFKFRKNNENIEEFRYGKFGLNDFLYGTQLAVGYGRFNLIGTYNFSNVLKSGAAHHYNPYTLGVSLVF